MILFQYMIAFFAAMCFLVESHKVVDVTLLEAAVCVG